MYKRLKIPIKNSEKKIAEREPEVIPYKLLYGIIVESVYAISFVTYFWKILLYMLGRT